MEIIMAQTPREIVKNALTFNYPERLPRHLWYLPWAEKHHPQALAEVKEKYPDDFVYPPNIYKESPVAKGDPYKVGTYIDEWNCKFENIHEGIIGEVKEPVVTDINDLSTMHVPWDVMPDDLGRARDEVNRFCAGTDRFVFAAACPRPWERMQFLRGTVDAMMDIMSSPEQSKKLLGKMHDFDMKLLEFWAGTDVDTLMFMDDWGSQNSLLIPPPLWVEMFKPLYKDYCDLAKANGKFIFMHSDGHITAIYPHLIEIGVSAVNSQLFCMDMDELAKIAKGKITFWGEIDRQHVLPDTNEANVRAAVRKVAEKLYDPSGGIIAQFELSPGSYGPNACIIYDEWDRIHAERAGR
jgi:uroporphyrinogen decarboxylase